MASTRGPRLGGLALALAVVTAASQPSAVRAAFEKLLRFIELGGEPMLASVPVISDHEIEELKLAPSQQQADPRSDIGPSKEWPIRETRRSIPHLLRVFHDDPEAFIRERAACSLAQSGMLSGEARKLAIPDLLDFTEDPVLDSQTRTWAYQALRDITGESLPNQSKAWRDWWWRQSCVGFTGETAGTPAARSRRRSSSRAHGSCPNR